MSGPFFGGGEGGQSICSRILETLPPVMLVAMYFWLVIIHNLYFHTILGLSRGSRQGPVVMTCSEFAGFPFLLYESVLVLHGCVV
jgi:hypothetical protein